MPARNGRHGHLFTWEGIININNKKYELDEKPIDPQCSCPICRSGFTRAYVHHLIKANEILGLRFCVMHNLHFYNTLMERIRESIKNDNFDEFAYKYSELLDRRI